MANGSVGGLFQYTTRQSDLATAGQWQPGDPWSGHYSQVGYEDRDQQLEDYLASGVTTRRFYLVDAFGVIVSTFGSAGPFASGTSIKFMHNNPSTTDSFIWWSQPATFGSASSELFLEGPEKNGAVGNPSALSFAVDVASGLKTTTLVDANTLALGVQDATAAATAEIDMAASGAIQVFTTLIDILNLSGAAHAEIKASAFTVVSTEREKIDVAVLDDARLLDLVREVRAHTFKYKMRPQTSLADPKGRRRGTTQPRITRDHDCALDDCAGTTDNPCMMMVNDTHRFGLIAEHVHKVAPELTNVDADHLPDSIAVDQVAAAAFGAVGALLRKVELLEQRIVTLEGLTGVGR